MGRKRKITEDQIALAQALYACDDVKCRDAAAFAGMSLGSLNYAVRKGDLPRRRPARSELPTRADKLRERGNRLFQSAANLIEEGRRLIEDAEKLDRIDARSKAR